MTAEGRERHPAKAAAPEDPESLRRERDYYRQVAEGVGRKALADFQEMSRLIVALRATEEALRSAGEELERKVEARTQEVSRANEVLRAEVEERTRAEAAARESEALYRLLMETSPDSISVVDASGTLVMANPQALALFGHANRAEVVGRSLFEWVPEEDQPRALEGFQRLLAGDTLRGYELKLRRKGGESFWASVNGALVRSPEGAPRYVIIVSTDITARKRADVDRLRALKLDSLGVLAGGLAHDFNNLLTAIVGNVSFARTRAARDAELMACLEEMDQASQRARELTFQLLTFSRGGQPLKRPLSLAAVVPRALALGLREAPVRCEVSLPSDLWPVEADEGQLSQVVTNLATNAAEAMPSGGTLTVTADNVTVAQGDPSQLAPGRYVRLRVKDTGEGIAKELLAKVFDPFFSTRERGSGLGLAVVYAVLRNHDGGIEVESEPGEGATFILHLPAVRDVPGARAREGAPVTPSRGRVLVMDDEKVVRDVALRLLKSLGWRAVAVRDGEEALEAWREALSEGNPFDLAIMDLTIAGGMGGQEAVQRLLALDPEARVIVSSGYSDDPVLSDHRRYGFRGVLPKPYKLDDLRAVLTEASRGEAHPRR